MQQKRENMNVKNQNHLQYSDTINLGAFHTPTEYVEKAWKMIDPFIQDTECIMRNDFFKEHIQYNKSITLQKAKEVITHYFTSLTGEHYVYQNN